jgi:chemotaxis protein MotA
MLAIIGIAVVTISVFLGFAIAGGPLLVLIQPAEFLIIGGSAAGSLLIASSPAVMRQIMRQALGAMKASPFNRALYLDLLQLMYELLGKAKKSGLIALEKDLASPAESPIFSAHPAVLARTEAVHFLSEALGMLVDGTMRADDFEMVLGAHLDTHHDEQGKPAMALLKVGDALPGLGIVAAVLGIIITMQHVAGKPEEIGHHVAVALVGTFLGIFLSYGYVQPLAANMENQAEADSRFLLCIKNCLVAFARGAPPLVAVEVARHVIWSDDRPDAEALSEACRNAGSRPT